MAEKINIVNPELFFKSFEEVSCGKTFFAEPSTSSYEIPFSETKPIEGYEPPINAVTKEVFPYCCDTHKHILKITEDWYEQFPDCCEHHRPLLKASWFKKEDYKNVALKVVQQLSYTGYHISKQLELPDWYKDITDYIEYNINSFGQLPMGFGNPVGLQIYVSQLKYYIQVPEASIPLDKRKRLIQYIENFEKPPDIKNPRTDPNILFATYQRWLKIFPFGVSYFANLKQKFSKELPFLAGKPELNKYIGLAKAKLKTPTELIETLTGITNQLLQQIDITDLLNRGLISDTNKHTLELANANHRLKQNSLLTKYSKGEMKYVKVLKTWLANEKEYFKEILPMIKEPSGNAQSNNDFLIREDYYKIILEIYNLHRPTISDYLSTKYQKHISKNPQFLECLYRDINKVMEGVHKEGDLDIDLSSGDFQAEFGDVKLTGNPTNLDDAMTWLWMKLIEGYASKDIMNMSERIKRFEYEILNRNDYTPAYAKKLAELNQELKNAKNPKTKAGKKEANPDLTLSDIFINDTAYSTIKDLLISKGYCQEGTMKWKDEGKGNKGLLIAILKDLRAKGYYKDEVRPSKADYQNIAINSFGWTMSIETIKKAKPGKFHLGFIPAYTEV